MRNALFIISLWFAAIAGATGAENLMLTDGATVTGEIVKADENILILRLPGEVYSATNLPWLQLSQDALKSLADNPKTKAYVTPFLQHSPAPEIKTTPITRLAMPESPSLFGGLAKSSVGVFILLVLYAANLYASYEVAIVRGRPVAVVMGLAAVLPVVGPVIFLAMPVKMETPPEETAEAEAAGEPPPLEEIQISEASWQKPEHQQAQPQVFARGKFTFNKRFIETKFADFVGGAAGEMAEKYTLEIDTTQDRFAIVRITQINTDTVVIDAVQRGTVTVPLAEIQEIILNPKSA
ncbi:MAG: hypothetical protein WCH99_13320 [Verrucomicrobiota bacterium]